MSVSWRFETAQEGTLKPINNLDTDGVEGRAHCDLKHLWGHGMSKKHFLLSSRPLNAEVQGKAKSRLCRGRWETSPSTVLISQKQSKST